MTGAVSTARTRQQVRVTLATLIHQGVRREDLMADLVAAGRGIGNPGPQEIADGLEIAQLWADIEAEAPFQVESGPPPLV